MQQDNVMEIKRIKNILGWCACKDCKERATVYCTIKGKNKKGKTKLVRRFFICPDHAAEIAVKLNGTK